MLNFIKQILVDQQVGAIFQGNPPHFLSNKANHKTSAKNSKTVHWSISIHSDIASRSPSINTTESPTTSVDAPDKRLNNAQAIPAGIKLIYQDIFLLLQCIDTVNKDDTSLTSEHSPQWRQWKLIPSLPMTIVESLPSELQRRYYIEYIERNILIEEKLRCSWKCRNPKNYQKKRFNWRVITSFLKMS